MDREFVVHSAASRGQCWAVCDCGVPSSNDHPVSVLPGAIRLGREIPCSDRVGGTPSHEVTNATTQILCNITCPSGCAKIEVPQRLELITVHVNVYETLMQALLLHQYLVRFCICNKLVVSITWCTLHNNF